MIKKTRLDNTNKQSYNQIREGKERRTWRSNWVRRKPKWRWTDGGGKLHPEPEGVVGSCPCFTLGGVFQVEASLKLSDFACFGGPNNKIQLYPKKRNKASKNPTQIAASNPRLFAMYL